MCLSPAACVGVRTQAQGLACGYREDLLDEDTQSEWGLTWVCRTSKGNAPAELCLQDQENPSARQRPREKLGLESRSPAPRDLEPGGVGMRVELLQVSSSRCPRDPTGLTGVPAFSP